MSQLTDYLTSLANKIRTVMGTSQPYTPTQAVSAIDAVYNLGVIDAKEQYPVTGVSIQFGSYQINCSYYVKSVTFTNSGSSDLICLLDNVASGGYYTQITASAGQTKTLDCSSYSSQRISFSGRGSIAPSNIRIELKSAK